MTNAKALVAEFIGTFALILIGADAGAVGLGGLMGVALPQALLSSGLLTLMVTSLARISTRR